MSVPAVNLAPREIEWNRYQHIIRCPTGSIRDEELRDSMERCRLVRALTNDGWCSCLVVGVVARPGVTTFTLDGYLDRDLPTPPKGNWA